MFFFFVGWGLGGCRGLGFRVYEGSCGVRVQGFNFEGFVGALGFSAPAFYPSQLHTLSPHGHFSKLGSLFGVTDSTLNPKP